MAALEENLDIQIDSYATFNWKAVVDAMNILGGVDVEISEAEFEVMKIVWQSAPINTNEITERLLKTTSWSAKTIQTLIRRLVTKGALSYEKQGRVFVYTPLMAENEYIAQKSDSFLRRFYDGDIGAMLSAYLDNNQLSETDISKLRSILSREEK